MSSPACDREADDVATLLGHKGVRAMADYKQWKAQLPPVMAGMTDKALRLVHGAMLRGGVGVQAQAPLGGPPAAPAAPPGAPPAAPLGAPGSAPNVPPIPKYAGSINLHQRLDYGEDALEVIQQTQREFTPLINEARRGKLTVQAMQGLADNLSLTPEQIRHRKPGTVWNAEKSMKADQLLKQSASGAVEMAKEYVKTPPMKLTLQQQVDFLSYLQGHVALQAQVAGDASEAGRALGIRNRLRFAVGDPKAVQALLDQFGKTRDVRHLDEIARLMSKIDPNDVRALGRFAKKVSKPTRWDYLHSAFIEAALSGPPTPMRNALSGILGSVLKPVEAGIFATQNALLHGASRLAGSAHTIPRERFFGEAFHTAKELLPWELRKLGPNDATEIGIRRGFKEAMTAAIQAYETGKPTVGQATKFESDAYLDLFPKWKHGRPTRILLATDQFFEALFYRMDLNAQAYRQALGEGKRGIEGISKRMAEIIDNPSDAQKDAAVTEALYRTFNKKLGTAGQAVMRARQTIPGLRWLMLFLRTPVNIVKFGTERSPLNSLRVGRVISDYRAGKITAGDLSEETGKMLLGWMLAVGVGELVAEGYITGGGPKDPAKRRTWEAKGWEPYSIKLSDSYNKFMGVEPLGIPLAMIADFVEASQFAATTDYELDKLVPQIMHSFSRNLFDQTWVSGLMGVMKTLYEWERYGEAWAQRTAGSLIPNIVGYAARAGQEDRYLPETIGQKMLTRIPGAAGTYEESGGFIPHAIDIYGRVEKNEPTMIERFASPFRRSPIRIDQVTPELLRLGISLDAPSRKIEIADLEGATMPPSQELEILARARGLATFIRAAQVVDDPEWKALTDEEQKDYLSSEVKGAKRDVTMAAKMLIAEGIPLTLEALVGELMEEAGGPSAGPPQLR